MDSRVLPKSSNSLRIRAKYSLGGLLILTLWFNWDYLYFTDRLQKELITVVLVGKRNDDEIYRMAKRSLK
jgi:hypothetical protein